MKAAIDVHERDVRHLAFLRDRVGGDFTNGVILHCGQQALPLGDRITALPINSLWA